MEDIIHFAHYTYTPKLWQSLTYEDIIKKLPSSKQLLIKLNEYFNLYPEFQLKLRTNLWRIQSNPVNTLGNLLPIDLWYKIDSYISESRFHLLIRKCKIYYIILIQSQIKDEIENNSRTTNETETVIDDQIIQYSNTDFELPSQYVDPGDGGGGEGGATSEFYVAT